MAVREGVGRRFSTPLEVEPMRSTGIVLALATGWLLQPASLQAGGKEVTLTGKIMCAKCELKETAKCQTAIRVTEGGKQVTYYFVDKGASETYHEAVCGSGQKDGKVTGVVSEKNGKKLIVPTNVVYTT